MNALAKLDEALDALDGALRGLHGPGARRLVERRLRTVLDERYGDGAAVEDREIVNTAGRPVATSDLEGRVLAFLGENPRASARALREGVEGRNSDIDEAVSRLTTMGLVDDAGNEYRRYYIAVPEAGHAVPRSKLPSAGIQTPLR